jgi:hypothetical protein
MKRDLSSSSAGSTLQKNLKLALLAGTCLGAVAPASAATVVESTDFSNTLAGALSSTLPVGTDVVTGAVNPTTDRNDFVAFGDLLAGTSFSISFGPGVFNYFVLDSAGTTLASATNSNSVALNVTVPTDGVLVAQVQYEEGAAYTIGLTAQSVPEPSAAILAGAAAMAGLLRRRRKASIEE